MYYWIIIIVFILIFIIIIVIFIIILYTFPGFFIDRHNSINTSKNKSNIVSHYDFLDEQEIKQTRDTIKKISKDNMIYRNSVMNTIGIPLYVEGSDNQKYQKNKDKYNQILSSNFDWLYPKLINKLEYITEEKCVYDDSLSLPGFHVFKAGSWLGSGWAVASLHVDKQYEYINSKNIDNQDLDQNDVFSFTIGIELPDKSGLYIYDCTEKDVTPGSWPFHTYFNDKKLYKVYYQLGELYIHDGLHYHMISEFNSNKDRITLQGHGIWNKKDKKYIIYW